MQSLVQPLRICGCARGELKAKLQALFLPTHILVPSCRRPNLRDRCLQKASRTRSEADGRDLCVFLLLQPARLVLLPSVRTPPTRRLTKARMARGHLGRKGKPRCAIQILRADGAARPFETEA